MTAAAARLSTTAGAVRGPIPARQGDLPLLTPRVGGPARVFVSYSMVVSARAFPACSFAFASTAAEIGAARPCIEMRAVAGRVLVSAAVAFTLLAGLGATPAAQGRSEAPAIRLGGLPLALVSARGSLWVLTCDRGCSGMGRRSVGRVVRIDPGLGRVLGSAPIARPGAIAVGAQGVYATDFYRHAVRRLDPTTLRQTASLQLVLPVKIASKYAAFLPNDVVVGAGSVWVSTEWCAVARVDERLHRAIAHVRLPCDAYQTMAFGADALWISESLAGLYRIDPASNHVVARIQIGPPSARLVVTHLLLIPGGSVLAVGVWTKGGAMIRRNGLARIDASRNRAGAVTALPPGPLIAALGDGSPWLARVDGSVVERIDPRTGSVIGRLRAKVGARLAVARGRVWTADPNGTIRQLPVS